MVDMVVIVMLVVGFWVLAAVPLAVALGRAASREMPARGAAGSMALITPDRSTADRTVAGRAATGRPLAG